MAVCPLPRDDTLNTSFAEYLAFSLIFFIFLQVPHKLCCGPVPPLSEIWGAPGTCPRQLYGAGAYAAAYVYSWRSGLPLLKYNYSLQVLPFVGEGRTSVVEIRRSSSPGH